MLGIYGSDVSRGDVVRAADVGATDLSMLEGSSLFGPKLPFVPGYEIAAVVEAIGSGVTNFELGQRVAALVCTSEDFLPIPNGVSDRDAAAVILNYVTAWQMIHRVAKPGRVRPLSSPARQAAWARQLGSC